MSAVVIEGRGLSHHPLAPEGGAIQRFRKVGRVIAIELVEPAAVATPEGTMLAEAGDFLLTDDPPTHAWPVKRDVFLRTYVRDFDPDPAAI